MLESTTTIWRYMKLSTLLLLLDGKAWLPSIATLRSMDPLEGQLGKDFYLHLMLELGRLPDAKQTEKWLRDSLSPSIIRQFNLNAKDLKYASKILCETYIDAIARHRVAWCWFKSEMESAAMWHQYGNRGIAVKTTVSQLDRAFPSGKGRCINELVYVDRNPNSSNSIKHIIQMQPYLLLRPYFLKAAEYSHEGEVRLVAHCHPKAPGLLIEGIDSSQLINEIIISPLIPLAESESTKLFLRKFLRSKRIQISQSDLNGKSKPDIGDRLTNALYSRNDTALDISKLPSVFHQL